MEEQEDFYDFLKRLYWGIIIILAVYPVWHYATTGASTKVFGEAFNLISLGAFCTLILKVTKIMSKHDKT